LLSHSWNMLICSDKYVLHVIAFLSCDRMHVDLACLRCKHALSRTNWTVFTANVYFLPARGLSSTRTSDLPFGSHTRFILKTNAAPISIIGTRTINRHSSKGKGPTHKPVNVEAFQNHVWKYPAEIKSQGTPITKPITPARHNGANRLL
jgi:hypothetical protein